MNVKLIIICKLKSNILNKLKHLRKLIYFDLNKINVDFLNYIHTKVNEFFMKKNYSLKLKQNI